MGCPFSKLTQPFTKKTIEIGWIRNNVDASAIYYPPERIVIKAHKLAHSARCPATQDHRKNRFLIRAPFDMRITMKNGNPSLVNPPGDSALKAKLFVVEERVRWLDPNRPILQMKLPYAFVSDDVGIRMRTTPAYDIYDAPRLPGVLISGDLNIYDWPLRNINWSFEWCDTKQDIVINRGDPLYVVEFPNTEAAVKLIELNYTIPLSNVMRSVHDVTGYVNTGTREIMKAFGLHRPKKIIPMGKVD